MGSQFCTAVGAFVGTFLGIWIAETSGAGNAGAHGEGISLIIGEGLFGTSVAGGELVIPMTAGGKYLIFIFTCLSDGWMDIRFLVYCKCERDSGTVGRIQEWETGAQRVRRDGVWCFLHGKSFSSWDHIMVC